MKRLPLGTGYAAWTGIGAVGSVIVGITTFDEPATPARLVLIAAVIAGILGLQLTQAAAREPGGVGGEPGRKGKAA